MIHCNSNKQPLIIRWNICVYNNNNNNNFVDDDKNDGDIVGPSYAKTFGLSQHGRLEYCRFVGFNSFQSWMTCRLPDIPENEKFIIHPSSFINPITKEHLNFAYNKSSSI